MLFSCILMCVYQCIRAQDKVRIFISKMPISLPNPMFDHLLESSFQDDSNKWSNIGSCVKIWIMEIKIRTLIWAPGKSLLCYVTLFSFTLQSVRNKNQIKEIMHFSLIHQNVHIMIWTVLVKDHYVMLHAKYQGSWASQFQRRLIKICDLLK